jgi:hypothetical protein
MLDPVQLADPETVTLARCLGEPAHRSLQQRKLERRGIRTTEQLIETAFQQARIPEIEDLRVQFEKAKEWIRSYYRTDTRDLPD